ncbi:MAG: VOC family protein [Candidatus Caldarchaeum sp.]|nr:VOC family protein [Candidatus Caldarchaeum sp.]
MPFLDPDTSVQWVALTVSSLKQSRRFYTEVMGFSRLFTLDDMEVFGVERGRPMVILRERSGALPKPPDRRGLYHFALLLPSRKQLAEMVVRLGEYWEVEGAADHLVSEAVYLRDPDGHGVEVYADRPRASWRMLGDKRIYMATLPLDVNSLLAELSAEDGARALQGSWRLPVEAKIGHIHLHVSRLERAERFYSGVLGFDITFRMGSALFMSAGGYHHHIGVNTWAGVDAPPASEQHVSLQSFALNVVSEETLSKLVGRLVENGCVVQEGLMNKIAGFKGARVEDFDGNMLELVVPTR